MDNFQDHARRTLTCFRNVLLSCSTRRTARPGRLPLPRPRGSYSANLLRSSCTRPSALRPRTAVRSRLCPTRPSPTSSLAPPQYPSRPQRTRPVIATLPPHPPCLAAPLTMLILPPLPYRLVPFQPLPPSRHHQSPSTHSSVPPFLSLNFQPFPATSAPPNPFHPSD